MGAVRTLALRREPGTWALIASLVRPSPVSASSSSLIGALLLAGELGGLCFRMLNIRAAGWPCTRSGARHVSDRREHGHAPATVIQLGLRARPSSRPLEGREALGSCVRQRTYDRTHGRVSYLSLLSPRVSSREAFTSPSPRSDSAELVTFCHVCHGGERGLKRGPLRLSGPGSGACLFPAAATSAPSC